MHREIKQKGFKEASRIFNVYKISKNRLCLNQLLPRRDKCLRFLYHEATKSICIPPGWDASPWQGSPQH